MGRKKWHVAWIQCIEAMRSNDQGDDWVELRVAMADWDNFLGDLNPARPETCAIFIAKADVDVDVRGQ